MQLEVVNHNLQKSSKPHILVFEIIPKNNPRKPNSHYFQEKFQKKCDFETEIKISRKLIYGVWSFFVDYDSPLRVASVPRKRGWEKYFSFGDKFRIRRKKI